MPCRIIAALLGARLSLAAAGLGTDIVTFAEPSQERGLRLAHSRPDRPDPPVFRLGSGADVVTYDPRISPVKGNNPKPVAQPQPVLKWVREPHSLVTMSYVIAAISILILMMPAGGAQLTGGNRDFNYRVPPAWSPENESSYSFRAYMTDISIWIMLTDLQPHQQCAAIIMRLGGAAREMARQITPQEMMQGGVQNGVLVDPVTYLLGALHARFSALEEESRLTCMTEMLAFARRPGENINSLLSRYETVRQRAAIEGQFVMSVEGCSLQILRACGIGSQHLFTLLQPFQGQLPQNDEQFRQMCTQLRRYGHISEGAPGNIAASLHGPARQARPGAYLAQTDLQNAARRSAHNSGMASYFGNAQADPSQQGMWDALIPQSVFPEDPDDAFAAWATGEGRQADPGTNRSGERQQADPAPSHQHAFPVVNDEDDGTDTDTSSDDGMEEITQLEVSQMSEAEASEALYLAYRREKRVWRRFTGKPVRKFRRHFKSFRRKGKGKREQRFLLHSGRRPGFPSRKRQRPSPAHLRERPWEKKRTQRVVMDRP